MSIRFSDYCVCPVCQSSLRESDNEMVCMNCNTRYPVKDGIAYLMPKSYEDGRYQEYYDNYEKIAKDDLKEPLEYRREYRHETLLKFIGDTRGKRILDIGSSMAGYLISMDAEFKVAFDISPSYLTSIPLYDNLQKVQGDAEHLPFMVGYFDIIIIADVLEHLLCPEKLVERLEKICTRQTRIIVHIPWEEDLSNYINQPYKYTHLRNFYSFTFHNLWRNFFIRKSRFTYPYLRYPLVFNLDGKIRPMLFDVIIKFYYASFAQWEKEWRTRHAANLPQGEWWLLWFFKPVFRMFELRVRTPDGPTQKLFRILGKIQFLINRFHPK